ncbi:MAG: hypothetical protein IIC76_15455 [Bacteroidetes bacterium]|nr:hypothetical protein [Bacteroidota bacterium]
MAKNIEIRNVDERPNVNNILWKNLFRYFGYLPKYKNNFYVIGLFRINNQPPGLKKIWSKIQFQLILRLPKFLNFDTYLKKLDTNAIKVNFEGVKDILFFSELSARTFLAKCLSEGKNVFCYIYSWDHPPKFNAFSKKINY